MAFRANESETELFERAEEFLLSPKNLSREEIKAGRVLLEELVRRWGPVVDSYPCWHPLVTAGERLDSNPRTRPDDSCGYQGLDHTVYFRNAILTCPYEGSDTVLESVKKLEFPSCVSVKCELLDVKLYHSSALPILITCEWLLHPQSDGTISQRAAVALMVEEELRGWKRAEVAETWETMRTYMLGRPCGKSSSLFVNQKTGQAMKSVYEALIWAGAFGPIRVDF